MILINDDDEDLSNKSITINDAPNQSRSSFGSQPNKDSSAVKNFINGFKNFIKPKITSADIEKDNRELYEDNSSQMTDTSFSSSKAKEDNCKDRIANKIINSIEVERNIGVFVALVSIGSIILCISLFLLPFIITSPKKFSFCFAVGSIFILLSFLFLVGTKSFVTKLFENKRIYISIMFILSIFIGIGFSLGRHYFISLICSAIQFISLIMFILTFIPGGRVGIECIKRTLTSPFTKIFINKAKSDLNNL
jgi:hypothetical protein